MGVNISVVIPSFRDDVVYLLMIHPYVLKSFRLVELGARIRLLLIGVECQEDAVMIRGTPR